MHSKEHRSDMATKNTCKTLQKIGENEPIFVLRAQDKTAAQTILFWLRLNPDLDEKRAKEARDCAQLMVDWPNKKQAD